MRYPFFYLYFPLFIFKHCVDEKGEQGQGGARTKKKPKKHPFMEGFSKLKKIKWFLKMFAADVWTFLCHKLFQIDHISRAIERSSNRTKTFNKNQRKIIFIFLSFLSFSSDNFTGLLLFFLFFFLLLFDWFKENHRHHTYTNTVGEVGRLVSLLEEKEHRTEYRLPITKQIQNTNTNTKTRFPTVSSFDSTFNDKRARCTISFPTHAHKHDLHLFSICIFLLISFVVVAFVIRTHTVNCGEVILHTTKHWKVREEKQKKNYFGMKIMVAVCCPFFFFFVSFAFFLILRTKNRFFCHFFLVSSSNFDLFFMQIWRFDFKFTANRRDSHSPRKQIRKRHRPTRRKRQDSIPISCSFLTIIFRFLNEFKETKWRIISNTQRKSLFFFKLKSKENGWKFNKLNNFTSVW